jgi:MFS family permease
MALSILVITVSTQPVFLLGAGFLDIGDELGFGPVGLGVLTSIFFLTASVTSSPLGRLVARIGWTRAMQLNLMVSVAVLVGIAAFADDVRALGALLVVAGAAYGFANPAANQALADHVDPRRRATIFGLKHAGIPSSTLVAGLAVPFVIVRFGWRPAFVMGAVLGLVVLSLVPRRPIAASPAVGGADPRRAVAPLSLIRLVGLASGSALATWAAIALSSYLVAAAVDAGFTESAAGLLLFAGSATSITARITMGVITDRIGGRGFGGIATLTSVGVVVFLLLTVASGAGFAVLVLAAFATGWGWPGLMTYTVVNANSGSVAASSAVTQAGVFVGAGIGPLVVGSVLEATSFTGVWLVVAAALAASAITVTIVGAHSIRAQPAR